MLKYYLSLSSTPKKVINKLQYVQNAAARLVTGTGKYERGLSQLMHDDLHWLVIPQRVQYKLAVTVHHCLLGPVHFPSPDQQSGIHCLIICVIQLLTPNNLGRT